MMRQILREPVLQFLVIALLLIVARSLLDVWSPPVIHVDEAQLEAITLDYQKNDAAEADSDPVAAVRAYLEDELLYREALKRDMLGRPEVRTVLIQLLRAELEPVLPEPTDAQLLAVRAQAPEQYRYPQKVAFDHVSYRDEKSVPERLLARLEKGEDPAQFGEPVRLARPLPPTFKPQLDRVLGQEVSEAVFVARVDEWFGPVVSERGIHYIRVTERNSPAEIPFEQVRETLKGNWQRQEAEAVLTEAIREMAVGYEFDLPEGYKGLKP